RCLDLISQDSTRITICKHILCQNCIETVIRTQQKCPMCRTELSSPEKCLVAPAVKAETDDDDDHEEGNSLANMGESSSKLDGLIHILEGPHSLFPHFLETSFPIHLPSDSLLNPFSISFPILSLPRNISYTFLVLYVLLSPL